LIAAIVNELLEARGPTEDGWGGLESPKESWLDEDWLWARMPTAP
jgi:hypothetical protein